MYLTRSTIGALCAVVSACWATDALAQREGCDALYRERDALAAEARSYAQAPQTFIELLSQARALRPEVLRASDANLQAFLAGTRQLIADNKSARSAVTDAR